MRLLKKLFSASEGEQAAHRLYAAAVAAARRPDHYLEGGVPDSVDGRFDLIVLYVHLVVERLRRDGDQATLEDALVEVFFADMDRSLREMGVGDMGVGRRVRTMAEAFFGRAQAYDQALLAQAQGDGGAALAAALARNLYRGQAPAAEVEWMVARVGAVRAALGAADTGDLAVGRWPQ